MRVEIIRLRVSAEEDRELAAIARSLGTSRAGAIRHRLGWKLCQQGGVQPGAGRPCKCAERRIECKHKKNRLTFNGVSTNPTI